MTSRIDFCPRDDADDALLDEQFRQSVDHDSSSMMDDLRLLDAGSPTNTGLPRAPLSLPLSLPTMDTVDMPLWNLISPCYDSDDDEPLEEAPAKEEEKDRPEPEASPRAPAIAVKPEVVEEANEGEKVEEEEESVRCASSSDDEDEEIEVYVAEPLSQEPTSGESASFLRRRTNSLDKDEHLDSVTEADELDELDALDALSSSASYVDDSASEDGSVASSSARVPVPTAGRWVGRIKSRTYSGPASAKMHQAYDTLRARTLSATATLRHAARSHVNVTNEDENDGGFSSDDEDYDHERASRTKTATPPVTPSRITNLSFPTRLTAVKNMQLPTKLLRFRTSSAATTSSEESFVGSNCCSSVESTPLETGRADQPTTPTTTGMAYSRQELKHKATACATRAAGLLGAASAEAARKLRTTRSFRMTSQPPSASSSMANSPIVDRDEQSPALPPLPIRTTVASSAPTASSS